MNQINCWEFKNCGRQLGGEHVASAGLCPAGSPNQFDGVNGGQYAGRFCWAVAGILSGVDPVCSDARTPSDCSSCEFFRQIVRDRAFDIALTVKDAKKLQGVS